MVFQPQDMALSLAKRTVTMLMRQSIRMPKKLTTMGLTLTVMRVLILILMVMVMKPLPMVGQIVMTSKTRFIRCF